MRKFNPGIKFVMLLICCTIVSSISWAASGTGMIATFITTLTSSVQAYTACCNRTCNKWTRTCKQCNKYSPCQYTDDAALTAPSGLKATPAITSVSLSWTAVAGATSYIIYSGTSSSSLVQSGTATSVSYTQSNLTPNTKYFYAVAAKNASSTSAQCSPVQTSTLMATGIQTRYKADELNNFRDLIVEAYLPSGKFAGSCNAQDMSFTTNLIITDNMKLKPGIYQIIIKDRSGHLIESKSVTLYSK